MKPSTTLDTISSTEGADSRESSLVGQVLSSARDNDGRLNVRWRTSDGQLMERRLAAVKGLAAEIGDLVLIQRPANWPEWIVIHVIEGLANDSQRVQIEGKDEVVIRCGKASITLRRNGRVVVQGTYVESRSSGTNRIKGGAVLIN